LIIKSLVSYFQIAILTVKVIIISSSIENNGAIINTRIRASFHLYQYYKN
jgi:hypothetical protein